MKESKAISSLFQETLDSYLNELSLSKSGLTVEAYQADLRRFLSFVQDRGVKRISGLKAVHIIDWLGHCKKEKKSDNSINRYYMAIRSFARYLRKVKAIGDDLTQDITPPRNNLKAPYVPTPDEIDRILVEPNRCLEKPTEASTRDRAILMLLYSSGLRASELCDLELEDLKTEGITVKCGKRSKTRTVPITLEAALAINVYIELYRGKLPGLLFVTVAHKRQLTRQELFKLVSRHAKNAGIDGVTPHTLRHACATHLLDEGADLRLIQEVLGHSSIASTQRYTHLSSNKMQEMFKQFHPRKG